MVTGFRTFGGQPQKGIVEVWRELVTLDPQEKARVEAVNDGWVCSFPCRIWDAIGAWGGVLALFDGVGEVT